MEPYQPAIHRQCNQHHTIVFRCRCNTMRRWVVLLIVAAICAAPQLLFAQGSIEVITHEYAPYMVAPPQEGGIGVEMVKEAFAAQGVRVTIRFYPPKRAQQTFLRTRSLAYLGLMSHFSEPDQLRLRFVPDVPLRMVFFYYHPTHPGGIAYRRTDDLAPYTVGTMLGSATSRTLRAAGVSVKEGPSMEGMFNNLMLRRIDLVTVLDLRGLKIITEAFPSEKENFRQLARPFMSLYGGLIFHQELPRSQRLAETYAHGLQRLKKNGTYLRVLEKYYGKGNVPADIVNMSTTKNNE